jgi:hypothetical protein
MISKRFSKSFYSFIWKHKFFSKEEKNEIVEIFKNKTVQVIFSVSLYLIIWSFVVAFIDATLLTRGVVFTFKSFGFLSSFLPSVIFIFINATVKFIFIYTYTKKRVEVTLKHILVGVIPLVGSLFFTTYLLRNRPLIAKALRQYFKYIKRDFKWIKVLRKKSLS